MAKEIAIYMDAARNTASFNEFGALAIYKKNKEEWYLARELGFAAMGAGGLSSIRMRVKQVIDFLGDCKVFVGREVSGILYFELEKSGCHVWEIEGRAEEFLDRLLLEEESASPPPERHELEPKDCGEGRFFVSLKSIQEGDGNITSKQVLQPFLRKGQFYSLEVLCSHVPPWLELELASGENYIGDVQRVGPNEVTVTIVKKNCTGAL